MLVIRTDQLDALRFAAVENFKDTLLANGDAWLKRYGASVPPSLMNQIFGEYMGGIPDLADEFEDDAEARWFDALKRAVDEFCSGQD